MIIKIKNFKIETFIGVYDWEKNFPRTLIINLEMHSSNHQSLISDNISDTIDYDKIYYKINSLIKNNSYQLIEKLANDILEAIHNDFKEFKIKYAKIEIDKLDLYPDVYSFAVVLEKNYN